MKAAFIYIGVGCSAVTTHVEVQYNESVVRVYGVGSVDEACELAKCLMADHFDWLELCGGFHADGCARVVDAVEDGLPVGYITYLPENEHQRELLPRDETRHMDWTYIFVDPTCKQGTTYAKLPYRNGSRDLHLYGVQTVEEGVALSAHLVKNDGFPLIEFSGDFGPENCKKAIDLVGDQALIGYVAWLPGKKHRG